MRFSRKQYLNVNSVLAALVQVWELPLGKDDAASAAPLLVFLQDSWTAFPVRRYKTLEWTPYTCWLQTVWGGSTAIAITANEFQL